MYAFTLQEPVPAGLTFYYEKRTDFKDTSSPGKKETEVAADFDGLAGHWKDLIQALNRSSLTPKEKTDILIRAWVKAFTYDDSQETFDRYKEVRDMPETFTTEMINQAIGNCGYATKGLIGLFSLAHLPVRDVACYLSDGYGNFSVRHNYHGALQVFLDGQWVLVEPQVGYLEAGYRLEGISREYKEEFESLLAAIPDRPPEARRQMDDLPDILPDKLSPLRNLRDEVAEALLSLLPAGIPRIPSLLSVLQYLSAQINQEMANGIDAYSLQNGRSLKDSLKATAKLIPVTIAGGFIVTRLASLVSRIELPLLETIPAQIHPGYLIETLPALCFRSKLA